MKKLVVEPLKTQVEASLIELFRNSDNQKLEPEEKLAEQLGVSRSTVREALHSLELKGCIAKRRGKGNFILKSVIDTTPRIDLSINFAENIVQAGYEPKVHRNYLDTSEPDPAIARAFSLLETEKVVRYRWIFYANETPAVVVYIQIPEKLFAAIPTEELTTIGNQEIQSGDILRDYCHQDFSHCITDIMTSSSKEVAAIFQAAPDTSFIYWQEYYYNIYDEPIAYSDIFFNPSIMKMKMVSSL